MPELIVALDYTDALDAFTMAGSLRHETRWVKVGLELFTREGPRVVQTLKGMGFKVMVDLKMFDIPNTVRGGVRAACWIGADLITLHLLGGERMIRAAVEEAAEAAGARLREEKGVELARAVRHEARSGLEGLYRQTVRAVRPAAPVQAPGGEPSGRTLRAGEPGRTAALTVDELDRAVRRDSRRYDGGMTIF